MKDRIESLIKQYSIVPVGLDTDNPQLAVHRPGPKSNQATVVATLREAKPEIIAYFRSKQEAEAKAAADRQTEIRRKLPGIDALRGCALAWEAWQEAEEAAFESPDGVTTLPKMPDVKYADLAAQYPKAAAYLRAEAYSLADHHLKADAGRKAMDAILAGEDIGQTLDAMEHWLPESAYWD